MEAGAVARPRNGEGKQTMKNVKAIVMLLASVQPSP